LLETGKRLGRYVLDAPLGTGASGEVWRATLEGDLGFRRDVALKLIRAGKQSEADLAREAHLGAALRHPHIATVLELFVADGFTVMAMELVDGPDLMSVFDAHPQGLAEDVVAAILSDLADGCAFAHELRDADGHALTVVHRDLKPSNVLIDHTGVLKIVDFGIARSRAMSRHTAPGMLRGTPYYLAPELLTGHDATPASDVWAIGAIAYEALLGHSLIPDGSLAQIATSISTLSYDTIARDVAARSERLAPIVTACLLRDPADRPSARAIVDALGHTDGRPALARLVGAESSGPRNPTLTLEPPERPAPMVRTWWVVACVGIALLAVLASGMLTPTPRAGGGVLRVADPRGRGVFDPYNPANTMGRYAFDLVVETATRMGPHGEPEPGVLASWESDRDWMTWTLHVRPDAPFHEHPCLLHGARPADAEDIRYSLRVAIEAGALELPLADADLEHAITADGDAVRVQLDMPYPFLAERLARLYVMPRELDHCEDLKAIRQPVGTGPFRFDKPPIGETLNVVRHTEWWGRPGGPKLEGVTFVTIPESAQVLAGLRDGSVDAAVLPKVEGVVNSAVTPPALAHPLPTDAHFVAYDGGRQFTLKGLYVFPNRPEGALDPRLRQAISETIDRAAVSTVDVNVRYTPTTRFLDPSFLGFDPSAPPSGYPNLEDARARVAEVGRTSEITIGAFPSDRPLVDVWVKQLTDIGLNVRAVRLSTESLQQARSKPPCDLALIQITERVWGVDPLPFLLAFVEDLVQQGTASPSVHALLVQAAGEQDRDRRTQIYYALMHQLREELPFIPVGIVNPPYRGDTWLISNTVTGFAVPQAGTVRDEVWTHVGDIGFK
jgi:ABC-type transport system substrate-binding protein